MDFSIAVCSISLWLCVCISEVLFKKEKRFFPLKPLHDRRFLNQASLLYNAHQAVSQFWIFGLFQACHYARVVVWTPYDQKLRSGKSWVYVPLR